MKTLRLRGFVRNDSVSVTASLLVHVQLTVGPGLPLSGQCPYLCRERCFPWPSCSGLTAVQLDVTQELVHPQQQCEEWRVAGTQCYLLDQEGMVDS